MTELRDNIIALRERGLTYNQIAAELGTSKGTISYYVGKGQTEKHIVRQRKRRNIIRAYIQKLKQETACTDCGENYPYYVMEFDHLSDKKFVISGYKNYNYTITLEMIKEEIAKCEIVCSNCHKIRTYYRKYRNGSGTLDIDEYYGE